MQITSVTFQTGKKLTSKYFSRAFSNWKESRNSRHAHSYIHVIRIPYTLMFWSSLMYQYHWNLNTAFWR